MIEAFSSSAAFYASQLSERDLLLLAKGASDLRASPDPVALLRSQPARIEALLWQNEAFERVFGSLERPDEIDFASPLLLFSLAVHRTASELAEATYITEWLGPRQRTPVFDVASLREFLDDATRRVFLAELLASYTHIASGSVVVSTRRGLRRQRFSELDPVRLASLLDVVPERERASIYRRLGDVALFLTGVFPDHTALRGLSEIDQVRLRRASGLGTAESRERAIAAGERNSVSLLEILGARWYQMAVDPSISQVVQTPLLKDVARRFSEARRILNVLTDSFLFPFRSRWFGMGSS